RGHAHGRYPRLAAAQEAGAGRRIRLAAFRGLSARISAGTGMSPGSRKVCLVGSLRAGKSALWRALTGQESRVCGFSHAPLKDYPDVCLWDSQGGCSLDSLGQVFLGGAEAVLMAVAADMRSSGVEAARM